MSVVRWQHRETAFLSAEANEALKMMMSTKENWLKWAQWKSKSANSVANHETRVAADATRAAFAVMSGTLYTRHELTTLLYRDNTTALALRRSGAIDC